MRFNQLYTNDLLLTAIKRLSGTGVLLLLCILPGMSAIKGRVLDQQGQPIAAATVAAKEQGKATVTGEDGRFTLQITGDSTRLSISCIGYQSADYKAANWDSVTIMLRISNTEMAAVEVVSTGYQELPKERSTGSFVKIDNSTLNLQTGTNILKRLDGVTSGLLFNTGKHNSNPQNNTGITIRGLSTIHGPLDPLIVLDGFIYEGSIDNINPNDVDNITILKDAAAASIWGARAGNGVIVITTKRGKTGGRPQIGLNSNLIVTTKPDLWRLPQMSSSEYLQVELQLFNSGYFDDIINGGPFRALTPGIEVLLARREGRINAADSASRISSLAAVDSRQQYLDYAYRQAIIQQYAMNLRGGSTTNNYLLSAAIDNVLTSADGRNSKINLMATNNYRPVQSLQMQASVYYTNGRTEAGKGLEYGSLQAAGRSVPYLRLADDNGQALPVATTLNERYTDTAGAGLLMNWQYYPLEDYKYRQARTSTEEIYARLGGNWKPSRWLSASVNYQYQRQWQENSVLSDVQSFNARSLINQYSQVNQLTGKVTYIVPAGAIKQYSRATTGSQTLRGQLDIHHVLASQHEIAAIAGAEARQSQQGGDGQTLYGYQKDPLRYTQVDFVNVYPEYTTGTLGRPFSGPYELPQSVSRFVSLFTNASYTFRQRYTVSGSIRRDGSNVFGASTNDRWKPLWSAGLLWKLSSEPFFKASWIDRLALRSSYGRSGNVDISRTAEATGIYYSGAPVTGLPFARIQYLNNPSLRWEQAAQLNVGIDFSLWKGRLSGAVEYYRKKGTDLYGATSFDYTTWGGSSELVRNVAAMKGRGTDISLQSLNTKGAVKWKTSLLLSHQLSRTSAYYVPGMNSLTSLLGGGQAITPVTGKPLYAIAALKWAGLDNQGNPQSYLNGKPSSNYDSIIAAVQENPEETLVFIGPASPVFFANMMNTLEWKGITLSINLAYRGGYYFQKGSISYSALVGQGIGHADYSRRWQRAGDELVTNVPSFQYPVNSNRDYIYSSADINVLKADHIRLQFINLGYVIPKGLVKGKLVQLYGNMADGGILWRANKEGLDPEYPASIRPSRTWTLGLRAEL